MTRRYWRAFIEWGIALIVVGVILQKVSQSESGAAAPLSEFGIVLFVMLPGVLIVVGLSKLLLGKAPPAPPVTPSPAAPAASAETAIFCTACGGPLSAGARFCGRCGASTSGTADH